MPDQAPGSSRRANPSTRRTVLARAGDADARDRGPARAAHHAPGPDHLIIAARVALDDEISADQAEDLADDIDRRLADRLEPTSHVFVDPTQAPAAAGPQ